MTVAQTAVNYTETQTAELVQAYQATPTAETIAAFAERFGKSTKSIVAKLVNEKVYQPKVKAKGERGLTKAQLIAEIEQALTVEAGTFASFEKASKEALEALHRAAT